MVGRFRRALLAVEGHAYNRQVPGSGTEGANYTDRLVRLRSPLWKRLLNVQAPYRWNIRRLFGQRTVLDLGCGIGRNLEHLAPLGVGVDHNQHSVAICRELGLTAFTPDEFSRSEYAREEKFGGLLASHLVEHMTHDEAATLVGSYLQYLARDALVVFICPQERGYASDATHVEYLDWDALSRLALSLGLRVEGRRSFPLPRRFGKLFTYNEFVLVARK